VGGHDQAALHGLRRDGYAILPGAVHRDLVGRLLETSARLAADPQHVSAISLGSAAHFGVACPIASPYLDALECDGLLDLTTAYLGTSVTLLEVMLNVARPHGQSDQPPHADEPASADGPTAIVWNIALHSLGPGNGMTELYPTTHCTVAPPSQQIRYQPDLHPGDVLVRDAALVHRGRANLSAHVRLLLGIGLTRRVLLPDEVRQIDGDVLTALPRERWALLAQHSVRT
jgi:hypothetical protein